MDLYRVKYEAKWNVKGEESYETSDRKTVLADCAEEALAKVRKVEMGSTLKDEEAHKMHRCVAVRLLSVEPIEEGIDIL